MLVTRPCLTLYGPIDCSSSVFLSVEFSRQEYWGGLLFPSPGDLSDPGIQSQSPVLQADSLLSEPWGKPNVNSNRIVRIIDQPEIIFEHLCTWYHFIDIWTAKLKTTGDPKCWKFKILQKFCRTIWHVTVKLVIQLLYRKQLHPLIFYQDKWTHLIKKDIIRTAFFIMSKLNVHQ